MCGIFGGFGSGFPWHSVETSGRLLAHRGPDDFGFYSDELACLGNTRLAVQDLGRGHQPFISECGQIVVIQNGEIYNHVELRRQLEALGDVFLTECDTEVILNSYMRYGLSFVDKLNGMFAIAILDRSKRSLHLIRDRLGVKPLFFTEFNGCYTFGSEVKVLLSMSGRTAELDERSLSDYLSYNYVPPPRTLFRHIEHIKPGHVMTICEEGVEEKKWWSVLEVGTEHCSYSYEWEEEFYFLLSDATSLRCAADVEIGAFLSGGLDSSAVVAAARDFCPDKMKVFSIGFDDARFNELPHAQMAAKKFGSDIRWRIVAPDLLDRWESAIYFCDQPHGDTSFLPTWEVANLASGYVKVALTGDGGDELFGGYEKYLGLGLDPKLESLKEADFVRRYWEEIALFSDTEKAAMLCSTEGKDAASESIGYLQQVVSESSHQDKINQMLLADTLILLPGNNLVKPDRMGMAASLEARSPFLDYRMVEFAFKTGGAMKLHEGMTKWCMKKALERDLGFDLTYRKKQMFTVPVGEWFKSTRREFCKFHLNDLKETGWIAPEVIDEIFWQHMSGQRNRTRELRALVALQIWRSVFMS